MFQFISYFLKKILPKTIDLMQFYWIYNNFTAIKIMKAFSAILILQIIIIYTCSQSICNTASCTYNFTYSLSKNSALPNPFKGYVSYSSASSKQMAGFPLSMQNAYFSMKALMTGSNSFNLSSIENMLSQAKSRGHQAIIRVHTDYPGQAGSPFIPSYLTGVSLCKYSNYGGGFSPNYDDPYMIDAMVTLIKKLASVYDGDNRIAVFQVGFLGHWGEHHTQPPCNFASSSTVTTIFQAFKSAFLTTKLQIRYPNVKGTISTASLGMGYHDDSFNQDSLTAQPYFFYQRMIDAGATNQWQQYPIGGETRPQLNTCIFGANITLSCASATAADPSLIPEDLTTCINTLHTSWSWNFGVFKDTSVIIAAGNYQRALDSAGNMGYSLQVSKSSLILHKLNGVWLLDVSATIINQGVAPFYYRLSCNVNINGANTILVANTSLANLLPGSLALVSSKNIPVSVPLTAVYLQLISPDTYIPIRFAVSQVDAIGVLYIDGLNHKRYSSSISYSLKQRLSTFEKAQQLLEKMRQ